MDNFHDTFGFEIIGLKEATTNADKITAYEKHIELLQGLVNESVCSMENKVYELKKNNGEYRR